MPLPALAGVALSHRLAGLEFGVAIPASLGGSVRMNAGAHGHSLDEVVHAVELFDLDDEACSDGERGGGRVPLPGLGVPGPRRGPRGHPRPPHR